MNLRRCSDCGYTSVTSIDSEYPHKNCTGLMKLIADQDKNWEKNGKN